MFGYEKQKYIRLMNSLSQNEWKDVEKVVVANEEGNYLFACKGDNHIFYEMHNLRKGDRLYRWFEGENEHKDGYFTVYPHQFIFVPDFNQSNNYWLPFEDYIEAPYRGIYPVIFQEEGSTEFIYDWVEIKHGGEPLLDIAERQLMLYRRNATCQDDRQIKLLYFSFARD